MNREYDIKLIVVYFDAPDGSNGLLRLQEIVPDTASLVVVGSNSYGAAMIKVMPVAPRGDILRSLIESAKEEGYSHIVTIDALDTPFLGALPQLLEESTKNPEAIYIASRSRRGNVLTKIVLYFRRYLQNMWIRLYTGAYVADVASTFRLYPIEKVAPLELKANGYEIEQEILLKASWGGATLCNFTVEESRLSCPQRRGFTYTSKLALIWLKAFFHRFISPFSGAPVPGKTIREKVRNLVMHELRSNTSAQKAAVSVALGVYFGLLPIHGFQLVVLLFVSTKLRCNRPLAFLGVNISMPPLLPIVFYCSLKLGSAVTASGISISFDDSNLLEKGVTYGLDFVLGSLLLAHLVAFLTYLFLYPLFLRMKKNTV